MSRTKKTVSPSIPKKLIAEEPVSKSIDTLHKYLESCPSRKDTFNFDNSNDAYAFGKKLRAIAVKEEGVQHEEQLEKFDVEINYTIVRLKFKVIELATV